MCVLVVLCIVAVVLCVLLQLSCVYCCSCLVCIVAVVLCVLLQLSCFYCCHVMCICCTVWALLFFTLDAGLLARSQYSEGPATGHLDTGFSWFPCV